METSLPAQFGKYELLERIGMGGMAEIFRARTQGPGGFEKIIVIKRVLPELAGNRAFINLLIAEAKVSSLLNHPNIVQIHELGEVEGRWYIAMEYVDGADLLNVLSRCTRNRIRIPTEIALHIVAEVCRGLAHAHAAADAQQRPLNIIHRDVSPSNILISRSGDVKVMDFGVARADLGLSSAPESDRGVLKGKVGYMSPEQVTGHPLDRRSDVFALGIVLFECLTLKRLFVGPNDVQTLLNVREADIEERFKRHSYLPKTIRALLRRALAKRPEDRFQTATDFQEAILDHIFDNRIKVTSRSVAHFLEHVLAPDTTPESPAPPPPPPTTSPEPPTLPPPTVATSRPQALNRVDLSRASFQFRADDGTVFGPINLDRVMSLMAERAISPTERVSINGSDWMRARDVRPLVDLQPSLFEEDHIRPIDDGPINRLRTPSVFLRIALQRLTGKLRLARGTLVKELYFDKGEARAAHSNLKTDLFGSWLLLHGHISTNALDQALERVTQSHIHLGQALLDLGALDPDRLRDALEAHIASRILETFTWRDGWYEFYEGVLTPREANVPANDLARLVMTGIRTHYTLADLRHVFAQSLDRPLIVGRDTTAIAARLQLTADEERLRIALRTHVTLGPLIAAAQHSEATELAFLSLAFVLHQADYLAFRATPDPRPR
jgi:serine/threonine protein kinase